jgi:hypothetical protein
MKVANIITLFSVLTYNFYCQVNFIYSALLLNDTKIYLYVGAFLLTCILFAENIVKLFDCKKTIGYCIVFVSVIVSLLTLKLTIV